MISVLSLYESSFSVSNSAIASSNACGRRVEGKTEETGKGARKERAVSEWSLAGLVRTTNRLSGRTAYLLSKLTSFIWRVENFVVEYREVQC